MDFGFSRVIPVLAVLLAGTALVQPSLAAPCDTVPGNLVANCGFETGDFTGWTQSGNTSPMSVSGSFFGTTPTQGTHQAVLGPIRIQGNLTQTLATQAGVTYRLSFDLANPFGGSTTIWGVSWHGGLLDGGFDAPEFGYTTYSFLVVGTGSDTLNFSFRHDPLAFFLDNVSVAPVVPEPASLALLGAGLLGLAATRRRASRATA